MSYLKNIEASQTFKMSEAVNVVAAQVVSKTLVQNKHHSLTLFAFAENEEISIHESKGDALVSVLEGIGSFQIDDKVYELQANESIVMPANVPHALKAITDFKMSLLVIFDA